jgi:hypothetical protein
VSPAYNSSYLDPAASPADWTPPPAPVRSTSAQPFSDSAPHPSPEITGLPTESPYPLTRTARGNECISGPREVSIPTAPPLPASDSAAAESQYVFGAESIPLQPIIETKPEP